MRIYIKGTAMILLGITVLLAGAVKSESRNLPPFEQVVLEGHGNVTIIFDSDEKVMIEADQEVLKHVYTRVKNGTLYLGTRKRMNPFLSTRVDYTVYASSLTGIKISGSGEIVSKGLRNDAVKLEISGSGVIVCERIKSRQLHVIINGAGECQVDGKTGSQQVVITGTGDYIGKRLRSDEARVIISGAGDAALSVKDRLTVNIAGSGTVKYYGSPSVQENISGSGEVLSLGKEIR